MEHAELQDNWHRLGMTDPFWAILSTWRRGRHSWSKEEFFSTGVEDVRRVLERAESYGLEIRRGCALDFGCGVGRLTQALADQFRIVHGVDVAESMIAHARRYNEHAERCQYFINAGPGLREWRSGSYDFIISLLVFQHLEPHQTLTYVRELMRLLSPSGVLVIGVASHRARTTVGALTSILSRVTGNRLSDPRAWRCGARKLYGCKLDDVVRVIEASGGTVRAIEADTTTLRRSWRAHRYYATKAGMPPQGGSG